MKEFPSRPSRQQVAFTLLELLAAFGVLSLLLVLVFSFTSQVTRITATSAPSFQEARTAFETMTRMLSQAVLNTYWDYDNDGQTGNPIRYIRASELHFVMGDAATLTNLSDTVGDAVFFQAPLGKSKEPIFRDLPALLNSVGFYVRYSPSPNLPPALQGQSTDAYRLWMYLQPSDAFRVYDLFNGNPQKPSTFSWFRTDLSQSARNHVLANNVVLLLIRCTYEDADGNKVQSYVYDSRPPPSHPQAPEAHQIPPTLHLTLVAIDDVTATRLNQLGSYDLTNAIPFTNAARYADEIGDLQEHLNSGINGVPINYRIFESTVNINSSKWSK